MAEPTITCPNCKTEIRLTESLATPLIEQIKHDYEKLLADQVLKAQEAVDKEVAEKLKSETAKIEAEATQKAKEVLGMELEGKGKEIVHLQEVLKQYGNKLKQAYDEQAKLAQKELELKDEKAKLQLSVQKQVQEQLAKKYAEAKKEAEDELNLKVEEKQKTITDMQKQIDELKHKAEQGSQQLQGEVQELALEAMLAARFPTDVIAPVPKGEHGGDVVQRVVGPLGQACGAILWESKNTKNWSNNWLTKLKHDQREAKVAIAVIVSRALPKEVESFDYVDGVWVAHPTVAIPVALSLRQSLIEVAAARQAADGQQTKMDLVYKYLTGTRFRQRVQAIVEAFSSMQEDLAREKKLITKQWAKREQEIGHAIEATAGMYGDLQGIAGKNLQEIEGLSLPALTDGREE